MSSPPKCWIPRRLGDVLNVQNGFAFDAEQFSRSEGVPLLRIRDLKDGTRTEAFYTGKIDPSYIVKSGDFLIAMDGNFRCHRWNGPDALLNQRVCRLTDFSEAIDPEFVFYAMNEKLRQIENATNYSTVKHLSSKQIKAIELHFPPLAEQRRIASRIAECLVRVEEIELLRDSAAVMSDALLPSSLAAVFDDLFEAHDKVPLGAMLVGTRYGTNQKCQADESATPVLRIPNVSAGHITFENLKYCAMEAGDRERFGLVAGDVLVVRTNGSPDLVGRCAVFEGASKPFAFASYLIRLRVDPAVANPHFVAFFLASTHGRDAIASVRRTSAGQFNVNSANLRAIELPKVPLAEQTRIAERFQEQQATVRGISSAHAARSSESHQLRASVLRHAFAGEL